MALTVPTVTELENFKQEDIPDEEVAGAQMHLQAATDLMELATGLSVDFPDGSLEQRVMTRGILDLAWYIGTSMEDRDAQFSPFASERIGSYSYSKAQTSIALYGKTGVPFFDLAVANLVGLSDVFGATGVALYAENVMPPIEYYYDRSNPYYGTGNFPPESYNGEIPLP